MGQEPYAVRREFLRRVGLGLGLFTGTAAVAAVPGSRLFAGQFLKDKHPTQVPEGYYDPNSQLYHDAGTGQPMFVAETGEPARELSTEELLELIRDGRFVDVSKVQLAQAWCTISQQTTLSTTGCCPIQTDSERDTGCDDTPNPPPTPPPPPPGWG